MVPWRGQTWRAGVRVERVNFLRSSSKKELQVQNHSFGISPYSQGTDGEKAEEMQLFPPVLDKRECTIHGQIGPMTKERLAMSAKHKTEVVGSAIENNGIWQ